MMQTFKRLVAFDLDDTLYKEVDYLKSAYREISTMVETRCCIDGVYAEMMNYWQTGKNVFRQLIAAHRLDMQVDDLLEIYRGHKPDIALDEATQRVLEHLYGHCTLALVTDGRSVTQNNKITALGLAAYMAQTDRLISEETGFEKPSEEPFRRLMTQHPDCHYYYVGDNPAKDFAAPNRLGWTTICLMDNGANIHPQDFGVEASLLPQYRIHNIKEIEKIIYG